MEGRWFRLNMLGEGLREDLAIEIDMLHNRAGLIAEPFMACWADRGIGLQYIQSGNRIRVPSPNGSSTPIVPKPSMRICSSRWIRSGRLARNAYTGTAMSGRTVHCQGSRRRSIERNLKSEFLHWQRCLDG